MSLCMRLCLCVRWLFGVGLKRKHIEHPLSWSPHLIQGFHLCFFFRQELLQLPSQQAWNLTHPCTFQLEVFNGRLSLWFPFQPPPKSVTTWTAPSYFSSWSIFWLVWGGHFPQIPKTTHTRTRAHRSAPLAADPVQTRRRRGLASLLSPRLRPPRLFRAVFSTKKKLLEVGDLFWESGMRARSIGGFKPNLVNQWSVHNVTKGRSPSKLGSLFPLLPQTSSTQAVLFCSRDSATKGPAGSAKRHPAGKCLFTPHAPATTVGRSYILLAFGRFRAPSWFEWPTR